MRAGERDLLIFQKKYPEKDYCYPVPREAGDIYDAPSDGGSWWMYSGFEHYYFERTHPRWYWRSWLLEKILTRKEAWKEWVTEMMGK
jgi:hypothetical protein